MTTTPLARPRDLGRRGLIRALGLPFGLAIAVGATIGGGILRSPGDVAAQLPHAGLFLGVWLLGALNALLGATIYAELGTMIPRSGGIYTFARRALGDGVGFVVGFTDWLNWAVASAALILLIGECLGAVVPWLAAFPTATGFAIFGGIVGLQWLGVRSSGRMQEITSLVKAAALVALLVAAFVLPHAEAGAAAARAVPTGMALVAAIAVAMQGVIFAYDAYYAVVYCGQEMKDPGREVPRAIFRGLLLVAAIYLLLNVAFLKLIPIESMAGDPFVGATIARSLFGARGDLVIRAVMVVSLLGTVNAYIIAAPRILYAMSEDGLFARQALRVTPGGTPSVAMLLTVLVVALFLFSGSYAAVLGVDAVLIVALYVVVFTSFFVLRRREPGAPRPYRAWGYPWVQGLAWLLAVGTLGAMAIGAPRDAAITLGLFLVGGLAARWVRGRAPGT